ncbi:MAG TPA: hypothetical protein VE620_08930 [Myxococcales bacterium]|nr:hypothetical protein [Myxococcales bacterium]
MQTASRSPFPARFCAILAASALVALAAHAEDAPADPPPTNPALSQPTTLSTGQVAAIVTLSTLSLLGYAALVDLAGRDDDYRHTAGCLYYALALGAGTVDRGGIALFAGFLALGTYIEYSDDSPGRRRWVTGIGTVLTFAASAIEAALEKPPPSTAPGSTFAFGFSGTAAGFALRF